MAYPSPSPVSYLRADLFNSRSSSGFIVAGHAHGPMNFHDPPETFMKKGIQPVFFQENRDDV